MNSNKIETLSDFIEEDDKREEVELNKKLTTAFIGKRIHKFTKGTFSVWAFLFGGAYYLYRKMYGLFFITLGLNIGTEYFLGKIISAGIMILANIMIAFMFKGLYVEHAAKKVKKIKESNADKSEDELLRICKRKGGVTLIPHIILIVAVVAYTTLAYTVTKNKVLKVLHEIEAKYIKEMEDSQGKNTPDNLVYKEYKTNTLNYSLPDNFIRSGEDNTANMYILGSSKTDDGCSIIITFYKDVDNPKKSFTTTLEQWGNAKTERSVGTVEEKKINNSTWYYGSVKNELSDGYFYGSADSNKNYYLVEYYIYSDKNKVCSTGIDKFINSLTFK